MNAAAALVFRIRSKRICIFVVPVTGRITAWIETARVGGSSAFWHTNERSWSRAGGALAPDAGTEPSAIAVAAAAPATAKPNPARDMPKYQQSVPGKVPPTPRAVTLSGAIDSCRYGRGKQPPIGRRGEVRGSLRAPPRPWLIATARNLVLADRRRQGETRQDLQGVEPAAASEPPMLELDLELEVALATLSESDCEALRS
ncbi:MAG TPA: hypothetical protein VLC49_13340 [Solirubrobacteraceae bacterium]|nr:hypothetical protein [Solirubrobacteraceae bacterium]